VLVLCAACGPRSAEREAALTEIERLAFVPAESVTFRGQSGPPVTCENPSPLLVDRYEVSRGDWLAFQRKHLDPPEPVLAEKTATWNPETWSWAASWMTLDEARAFARERGMRLPTAREWLRVACGTRGQPFPWGQRTSLVANTVEMRLARPVPVGTFEQGATPFSTYEMCGNVWEWVEEPIDPAGAADGTSSRVWALGGSYTSQLRPLHGIDGYGLVTFEHLDLESLTRGEDIGLRCVADARAWLIAHADAFGSDPATHERLVAVGRRFGRDATAVLEDVRSSGHATSAIGWLIEGAQR
jgi:formylglycine-generating enzyme required for sulfatase activity